MRQFHDLPGYDLVSAGLRDRAAGIESVEALLVEIAAPRLRAVGLPVPEGTAGATAAELRLYEVLGARGEADPYSRYNALLRELVSFGRAAEARVRRQSAGGSAGEDPDTTAGR